MRNGAAVEVLVAGSAFWASKGDGTQSKNPATLPARRPKRNSYVIIATPANARAYF